VRATEPKAFSTYVRDGKSQFARDLVNHDFVSNPGRSDVFAFRQNWLKARLPHCVKSTGSGRGFFP
jgi:hypothetical protein